MPIRVNSQILQVLIYATGTGVASFLFVLMINVVGAWLGFEHSENVPIEKIGYLNVALFLISVALLALLNYGSVFYLIIKLFKFNRGDII
jgi:hypothetical protein